MGKEKTIVDIRGQASLFKTFTAEQTGLALTKKGYKVVVLDPGTIFRATSKSLYDSGISPENYPKLPQQEILNHLENMTLEFSPSGACTYLKDGKKLDQAELKSMQIGQIAGFLGQNPDSGQIVVKIINKAIEESEAEIAIMAARNNLLKAGLIPTLDVYLGAPPKVRAEIAAMDIPDFYNSPESDRIEYIRKRTKKDSGNCTLMMGNQTLIAVRKNGYEFSDSKKTRVSIAHETMGMIIALSNVIEETHLKNPLSNSKHVTFQNGRLFLAFEADNSISLEEFLRLMPHQIS